MRIRWLEVSNLGRVAAALLVMLLSLGTLQIAPSTVASTSICNPPMYFSSAFATEIITCDDGPNYGGGGGSYSASWNSSTNYTEATDPLKRFVRYPPPTPDASGAVILPSLPYSPPQDYPAPTMLSLTNAEIEGAMSQLGLTRAMLSDSVLRFFEGNGTQTALATEISQEVLAGLLTDAVESLTGFDANVTYWCGSQETMQPRAWVVIIPAVISCGPSTTVTVDAFVPDKPDYMAGVDSNNPAEPWRRLNELNYTFFALPDSEGAERVIVASQYRDLIWGTQTRLDKDLQALVKIRNLAPGLDREKSGSIAWTASGGAFAEQDNFTFTQDARFAQNRTLTARLQIPSTTFGHEYVTRATSIEWNVKATWTDRTLVNETSALMRFGDGQIQFNVSNQTDGVTFKFRPLDDHGRSKKEMTIASASGHPFLDTELKGTYFRDAMPILVIQFKGLPGDEVADDTTFPRRNLLRLDLGTDNDSFSVDVASEAAYGHFRAVLLTSSAPGFAFAAGASQTGRVQIAGGATDPGTAGVPWMSHSAHIKTNMSNSTVWALGGTVPVARANMSADQAGAATPTSQSWQFDEASTCLSTCIGWLADGATTEGGRAGVAFRTWAIGDSERHPDFCGFHHASGACY